MTAIDSEDIVTPRVNPYVGPRPLRAGEDLPAREQELRDLTDLLIAERITLLHAPSGAGKTSLIQAGVIPLLEHQGKFFGEKPFRCVGPLRVKTPARPDLEVHNRYVHSLALELLPGRDEAEIAKMSLAEVVRAATPWSATNTPVFILDQFEEILILDPADWDGQDAFFTELGEVLRDNDIWVLFAMREDYMGGLNRYLHHIPGFLQTTFRLDFLDTESAKAAITEPARKHDVEVTDEAATELISRLRTIRVQSPGNSVKTVKGPYVQPFQLQVVCRNLWRTLDREKSGRFQKIDLKRVQKHADIAESMRQYYRDTLAEVTALPGVDERTLREWFEAELITVQGFRTQSMTRPEAKTKDPLAVVNALQAAYLLRSDSRSGSVWYELAHDQLIAPIQQDNANWREAQLEGWQQRAREWQTTRDRELLVSGAELKYAQRRAAICTPSQNERDFLEESALAEQDRSVLERTRGYLLQMRALALLLGIAVVVLTVLLLTR
jgi:hypothetical protein